MSSFALRGLRVVAAVDDRRLATHVERHPQRRPTLPQLLLGVAAAGVLTASPADAGVILKQPQLKTLYTTENKTASPSASKSEMPSFGINVDIGSVSLPLTLAGCVGLYVVASKVGNGFDAFMSNAWVKDSTVNGVGYEEEINDSVDFFGGTFRKRR